MAHEKGTSPVNILEKKLEAIRTEIFADKSLSEDAKMRLIEMMVKR